MFSYAVKELLHDVLRDGASDGGVDVVHHRHRLLPQRRVHVNRQDGRHKEEAQENPSRYRLHCSDDRGILQRLLTLT